MKVLSIGNSFSTDATAYLHRAAVSAGVDLDTYNLYIGGCSLERHWDNVVREAKEYLLGIFTLTSEYLWFTVFISAVIILFPSEYSPLPNPVMLFIIFFPISSARMIIWLLK